jgi:cell division protein FtsZ
VQGISDIITVPGLINVDFADVKTIMSGMGMALMGTGTSKGDNRAMEATQRAITSPLLEEASIEGAKGLLVNITGGADMTLFEVNEAMSIIHNSAFEDANIIFGAVLDERLSDEMKITVIATGFDRAASAVAFPAAQSTGTDPHGGPPPRGSGPGGSHHTDSIRRDDIDVPTFIRKKAD